MKAAKIGLLVLMVLSLMSIPCYGQTAEEYYDTGLDFLGKKMYDEAIAAYKKAIEIDPQYVKAYNDLGVAYYNKKMYDEAIGAYKKAIETNPEYTRAYYNLGLAYYYGKKMYDEAIGAYKKAIETNPEYTRAYRYLGVAYRKKGMNDEAIAAYKKAIETNANYSAAHNNLAQAYYKKEEYGLATEHRDRAAELGYKVDPEFSQRLDNAQKTLEQPAKTTKKPESTSTPSLPKDIVKSFNKAAEFIKLLDEAKNSFLNEDYQEAQTFLDEARKILDSHLQTIPKPAVFFDLSTPENALRSFLEASFLNDEETARKCWSEKVPDYLISLTIEGFQEKTGQDSRPEDELIKLAIQTFRYERKWTGVNSYYVWATTPGEERSEDMQFIVVREESVWKILGFKVWEEEGWFKALTKKR